MSALLAAVMLLCGLPIGFVIGMLVAARVYRGTTQEPDDFDGGYTASNPPPVRTTIWYGDGDR